MNYKYFEPSDDIENYIANNDVEALKSILVGILNSDPTFATSRYDETCDYICNAKGIHIYEKLEKVVGEYELPREKWTKEYYRMLLAWLVNNYCEERLKYVKEVGSIVYTNEYTFGKDEAKNKDNTETFHLPSRNELKKTTSPILLGVILGAMVVIVILSLPMLVVSKVIMVIIVIILDLVIIVLNSKKEKWLSSKSSTTNKQNNIMKG